MTQTLNQPLIADDPADSESRQILVTELGMFFNKIGAAARFARLCQEELRRSGTISKSALQRLTSELDNDARHHQTS